MAKVIHPSEAEPTPVPRTRGTRFAVLVGPEQGAGNFYTRRFVMDPGARIPMHRHEDVEHEQVVIRGRIALTLDGERHEVGPGDAVWIPAGCAHAYENEGDETAEFICVVPSGDSYATEWLEEPPGGAAG